MIESRLAKASEKDYAAMVGLGDFAATLKLHERAREFYQKASAADPSKEKEIGEILANNERLIKEVKAAAMVKQIRDFEGSVEFAKAGELARNLLGEFADTEVARQNKDLPAMLEKAAKDFEVRKVDYLAKKVPDMYKSKRSSLLSQYAGAKYKISEALALANKVDDTIEADLAKQLKSTPEEIKAGWAKRELKQKICSYGDGSWIVKGGQDGGLDTNEKTKPLKSVNVNPSRPTGGFGFDPSGGSGGADKPMDLGRKIETKDQWWTGSSHSDRRNFLEADYAKNSAAVKKEIKTKKCSVCKGEGIRKEARKGVACECVCSRCHGAKEDDIVSYE
jgi:hypothetical protein